MYGDRPGPPAPFARAPPATPAAAAIAAAPSPAAFFLDAVPGVATEPFDPNDPKPPNCNAGVAGESITDSDRILSPILLTAAALPGVASALPWSFCAVSTSAAAPLVLTRPATGVPSAAALRPRSADDADDGGLCGVRVDALAAAALGVDATTAVLVPLL